GRYSNTWNVAEGIEAIDTLAGRFYVLRIERWSGTRRLVAYWYSPRIHYFVRLEDYLGGYVEDLVEYKSWSDSLPPPRSEATCGHDHAPGRAPADGTDGAGPRGGPGDRRPPRRGPALAREQSHGLPGGDRARGRPRRAGRAPDEGRRGRRHPRRDA